jgi:hypothetical protein
MAKKKPGTAKKTREAKEAKETKKKEKPKIPSRENLVIVILAIVIIALVSYLFYAISSAGPGTQAAVYTSMEAVLANPQAYTGQELLFTGALRKMPAVEEYLLEDFEGNTLELQGMNFGNYEINRNYDIRGQVVSNEYCFCAEASHTYYWKQLGEIPQTECESTGGQCKLGTFYTGANGTTMCDCQIQDILRSTYKDLGKMLSKTCSDTQNAECKNTTFEYSTPHIIVSQVISRG